MFSQFDVSTRQYVPTALTIAMEQGAPVVIEEFAHFNDDVLKKFQTILDNKTMIFDQKLNRNIHIQKGFKIIVSMNKTKPLPGALASRAHLVNYGNRLDVNWMCSWMVK